MKFIQSGYFVFLSSLLCFSTSCGNGDRVTASKKTALEQLHKVVYHKDRMTHFASIYEGFFFTQATKDISYYIMCSRIMKNSGELWFYNETMTGELPEEPVEQEIVRVRPMTVDTLVIQYYKIDSKKLHLYRQAWRNPSVFDQMDMKDIYIQDSCVMYASRVDSTFELRQHGYCPIFSNAGFGFEFSQTSINLLNSGLNISSRTFDKNKKTIQKESWTFFERLNNMETLKPVLDKIDAAKAKKQ